MVKIVNDSQLDQVEYLKILAEYTSDLISLHKPDGTFLYASAAFESVTGYSPNELIETDPYRYIHPDDKAPVRIQAHDPALDGEAVSKTIFRWITKDDKLVWLETFSRPIFDEDDGEVAYIACSSRDITEQKKTQDALARSESHLRMILDHTSDMFFVLTYDLDLEYVSGSVKSILGYDLGKLDAFALEDIVHPQDKTYILEDLFPDVRRGKNIHNVEFQIRHQAGHYLWVEGHVQTQIENEDHQGFIIISLRDISERVEARTTVQYQGNLLHNISDAIIATDHDFAIRSWNKGAENIFGWQAYEVVGRTIDKVFRAKDNSKTLEIFQTLTDGALNWKGELNHRHKDGRKLIVECTVSLLNDEYGNPVGLVSINRDVTEERKRQKSLEQQQRIIQALYETASTITGILNLDEMLDVMLVLIRSSIPWDMATIILFETPDKLRIQQVGDLESMPWATLEDVPIFQQVVSSGESLVLSDIQDTEHYKGVDSWVKTLLAVPIKNNQQVIGLLIMQDRHPDKLEKQHQNWLEAFASHAAAAINNANLYETLEANAAELDALYHATGKLYNADNQEELAQLIADTAVDEFGQIDCGIILIDRSSLKLRRVTRSGPHAVNPTATLDLESNGLIPTAIREQQMIYAPDVESDPRYTPNVGSTRSELVIPLKTEHGELLGAMDFQSAEIDAFDDTDLRLLRAFAERAALALENMNLNDQVRAYNANLENQIETRTSQYFVAKDRVETILNNSSDAIILTSLTGNIDQVNPTFNTWFKAMPDQYFNHDIVQLFEPDDQDKIEHCYDLLNDGQRHARVEARIKTPSGRIFDVDAAFSIISDIDAYSVVCSLRDITQQKQMEAGLISALETERELNSMKSQFISLVSHEFRSPLTTILSSALLMQDFWDRMADDRKRRHIEKIITESNRISGLMDNVLTMNRSEIAGLEFKPSEIDFNRFVRETVRRYKEAVLPRQNIVVNTGQESLSAFFDTELLTMLLRNLISNAAKYSPTDTEISISVEKDGEQYVKLIIADEGMGISEEDQEKMFTQFHRGANVRTIMGTGLGLTIVKQVVDLHEGRIIVDSEVGTGTTFTVILPLLSKNEDAES